MLNPSLVFCLSAELLYNKWVDVDEIFWRNWSSFRESFIKILEVFLDANVGLSLKFGLCI